MDITVPAPSHVLSRASCWTSLLGLWPFHLESRRVGEKRSTANWGFCTGKRWPWAAMLLAFRLVANCLWISAAETNYVIKKPEISVHGIFWRSLRNSCFLPKANFAYMHLSLWWRKVRSKYFNRSRSPRYQTTKCSHVPLKFWDMRNNPLGDLVVGAAQSAPAQTWMVYPLHTWATWWSLPLPGYGPVQHVTVQNNMKLSQTPEMQETCEAAAGATQRTVLQRSYFCQRKEYTLK